MVTQKDISVACGVSVAAVSRALNDHADISAGTKQRIKDMAEKMGYVKNSAKKKRDHTYLIGILFTEKELTVFHNEIIIEIREYLIKWGYDLLILNPVEKEKGAAERPGYLSRARLLGLEGILLFSNIQEEAFCLSPEQKGLRELVFGEIPVVAVDCGKRLYVSEHSGERDTFDHEPGGTEYSAQFFLFSQGGKRGGSRGKDIGAAGGRQVASSHLYIVRRRHHDAGRDQSDFTEKTQDTRGYLSSSPELPELRDHIREDGDILVHAA